MGKCTWVVLNFSSNTVINPWEKNAFRQSIENITWYQIFDDFSDVQIDNSYQIFYITAKGYKVVTIHEGSAIPASCLDMNVINNIQICTEIKPLHVCRLLLVVKSAYKHIDSNQRAGLTQWIVMNCGMRIALNACVGTGHGLWWLRLQVWVLEQTQYP